MTYIWASKIGCALDCDLRDGSNKYQGGSATDDGLRINTAMASATAANPITLIIDGSALISGLFLPAGGYWSIAGLGCGTGFFVKTGTNNDGIHNGSSEVVSIDTGAVPAPALRGRDVTLSNFTLNGNGANGIDGDSTSGIRQGNDSAWFFGISLINLDNITIQNLVVVNTPTYHIRFCNVGAVTVSGCVLQGVGDNTDGLHFDGPANDILISGCSFAMGDDSIALNCPEGYSGNISRVTVTNCTFNSLSLMRLYTTTGGLQFTIDTVSVSNCTGTLTETAFFIGLFGGSLPNAVTGLTISDCNLTAPVLLGVTECFGSVMLTNVDFTPINGSWIASEPNHVPALLRPPPAFAGQTFIGSSLMLQNCQILRNRNMDVAGLILENNSAINYLEIDGFSLQNAGSYAKVPFLIDIEQGSIGQLAINSLQSQNIVAPVSLGGFSRVGLVSGTGVLATGWEFPDAVMANGVPYISATTGLPSVKINGVVTPFPS
ncbi:MAG: glycosyl hydrolase family 28 protein [Formivibrio sp.]|nr:glycosyl hydrolase family 28 protein [Formivibrio sp.]